MGRFTRRESPPLCAYSGGQVCIHAYSIYSNLLQSRAYASIDPAPPTSGLLKGKPASEDISLDSIESLRVALTDPALPLFERYRAMFALRNIGTDEAVDALASGFLDDSVLFKFVSRDLHKCLSLTSGLIRHEIAFVFGQLLSPHSVPALVEVLRNTQESDMVRHEAAEALGGIGTPEVLPHLKEWMVRGDSPRVVRESCQVAIDMWEVSDRAPSPGWLIMVPVALFNPSLRYDNTSTRIQVNSNTQMGSKKCRRSELKRSLSRVPRPNSL